MNERSPLSSGQWRRAVHLTPESLVQTKYLPSGGALFLPWQPLNRTHNSSRTQHTHTQRQHVHRHQNILQECACGLCVCVWDQEIQKLDADWHSRLSVNIPVMLLCLVHCPWATNQNSSRKTRVPGIHPFDWEIFCVIRICGFYQFIYKSPTDTEM